MFGLSERTILGMQSVSTGVLSIVDVWSDIILLSIYYQDSVKSNSWVWFTLSAIIVILSSLVSCFMPYG